MKTNDCHVTAIVLLWNYLTYLLGKERLSSSWNPVAVTSN